MAQKGFFFDSSICTGCRTCSVACADKNDTPVGIALRRVVEYEGGTWTRDDKGFPHANGVFAYYVSIGCNQCSDPACVKVCPTKAHHKRAEDGLVVIDLERCIGCGMCARACPYHAPQLDAAMHKMRKCDGCVERTSKGQDPVCVEACVQRALEFGDIERLRAKHGNVAAIAPLPSAAITRPNLVIRPSKDAKPPEFQGGKAHKF